MYIIFHTTLQKKCGEQKITKSHADNDQNTFNILYIIMTNTEI